MGNAVGSDTTPVRCMRNGILPERSKRSKDPFSPGTFIEEAGRS